MSTTKKPVDNGVNVQALLEARQALSHAPAGAKFTQAPMKYFLRFDGAVGTHAGRIPGYPASHGCVRLPPAKAQLFFNIAEIGTPVRVFGKAPMTGGPKHAPVVKAVAATPVPATPKPKRFLWFGAR